MNKKIKALTKKNQDWKILLVEDGSIDIEDLCQFIYDHNLKIKLVVYRQGSLPPKYLTSE